MPFCNECGDHFNGDGIYCYVHEPSPSASPPYSPPSYSPSPSPSPSVSPPPNSPPRELVRQSGSQVDNVWTPDVITRMATNPDLHYFVDSLTIDANSSQATVVMNNNRVRCNWCEDWFATQAMLDRHHRDFPSGCSEHGLCFGKSENVVHATREDHHRCFVLGCKSIYRTEENWGNSDIVKHVRKEHRY